MTKQVSQDATSKLNRKFMKEAIALSQESVRSGKSGPFGAVIVKEGQIIAQGQNQVTSTKDPTAHVPMIQLMQQEAWNAFQEWVEKNDKVEY